MAAAVLLVMVVILIELVIRRFGEGPDDYDT
jgi:hypothetical protein